MIQIMMKCKYQFFVFIAPIHKILLHPFTALTLMNYLLFPAVQEYVDHMIYCWCISGSKLVHNRRLRIASCDPDQKNDR